MHATFGRMLFIELVVSLGLVMYLAMTAAIRSGRVTLAVLLVIVTSPIAMTACWLFVQRAQPRLPGLTHSSFAATADLFVITIAAGLLAAGWKRSNDQIPEFFKGHFWLWGVALAGFGFGWFMHNTGGKSDSSSTVLSERLHDSATSWAHNFGVTPALCATLLGAGVPLFLTSSGRLWAWMTLAVVLIGWGVPLVLDGVRSKLDPSSTWYFNTQWLDTVMDWARWAPLRR